MIIDEDEIFRRSSQYRFWFCDASTLATLRGEANAAAAASVMRAVPGLVESDCLSADEELSLVGFYITKVMELADFCEFPTNVKATAAQFLKRFYIMNSCMTYHPKEIMPCALFLATKAENNYISLRDFVAHLPRTSEEQVVAPEFLLLQALRFTLDVRHPLRGLEGGVMELLRIAGAGGKGSSGSIQRDMQHLILHPNGGNANAGDKMSVSVTRERVYKAHTHAKNTLKTAALTSDAYLHFSPAQIWLGAVYFADADLASEYLSFKLSPEEKKRVLDVVGRCAHLLKQQQHSKHDGDGEGEGENMQVLKRIDKKLYACRHPDKVDLVGLNRARKHDAREGETGEEKRKRRKVQEDGDDMFGPALTTTTTTTTATKG